MRAVQRKLASIALRQPSQRHMSTMTVFDRKLKLAQRSRMAVDVENDQFDYLRDEVAVRMAERINYIRRDFQSVADVGCNHGPLSGYFRRRSDVQHYLQVDMSEQMLKRAATTITGIDTIHTAHSTDSTTHGAGTSTQHTHHIHTPDNPHPTKRKNDILWEELFDTEIAPDPSSSPGLQQPQTDVPADANPIAGTPPSHTDTLTHPHIPTTSSPPSSSPSLDQLQEASHPAPPTSAPYINKFNHNLSLNAHPCTIHQLVADEEFLPLAPQSFDCVVSSLSMHWVNDLPSMMTQIRKSLKPDGVFMAAMIGGDSLRELRSALALADMERRGGVTPHISPFAHIRDAGNLLGRAGFTLPTVDHETLTIRYPDFFTLCEHLRGMGESNANLTRAPHVSSDIFLSAAAAYHELYADEDGLLPLTFQIIYLVGWSPSAEQPKPKERGAYEHSMKSIDQVPELQ